MRTILLDTGLWVVAIALDIIFTVLIVRRSKHLLNCKRSCPAILLLLNLIIFIACHVLFQMDLSVGSGVGLFAVLAMIRFRSEKLPLDGMVLLLFILSMGFIHAAFPFVLNLLELLIIDVILLIVVEFIRKRGVSTQNLKMNINNLDLLKPENRAEIKKIIESRTGLKVQHFEISDINISSNKATVQVRTSRNGTIKKPEGMKLLRKIRRSVASIVALFPL